MKLLEGRGVLQLLDQIIGLRRKGLSFRKIAKELDTTVGKVQYQWNKYMKSIREEQKETAPASIKQDAQPFLVNSSVWTSIQNMERNNGMEAWSISETSAFVFWRIPKGKWNIVSSYYGMNSEECAVVLKINDITSIIYNGSNAHTSKLIELRNGTKHCILKDLAPSRSYCFEIGVFDHYRSFLPILQSNPIQMPRNSIDHGETLAKEMENWVDGKVTIPNWIEHVSTYSYYEMKKREDVKKK
ncbi:DUF4912 domain-containing protein [Niallia sp. 03133]|uniref:DUF4912 domain-containing protein n=1 Tax=Niallia sp. 03133 TaxID=3458060 RepID=UPI0040442E1E